MSEKFNFTEAEKIAAQIVDQLCPVIADELNVHVSPTLFKRLTVRLAEIMAIEVDSHNSVDCTIASDACERFPGFPD